MNQTRGLKLLAFVIALILWAYVRVTVTGIGQDTQTQLEIRVPLETKGAGSDLIPFEKSVDTVNLTLRGDSEVVTELREGLVRAWVDLENVSPGSAWPEVQVLVPAGVQILAVDPKSVNVQLSPIFSADVPVRIETAGTPKPGFEVVGEPIFEPTTIKLRGPEALVNQVKWISGVVPVDGLGDTLSIRVNNLVPVNENGTAVMGTDTTLRLTVREVRATIQIEQQKTVEHLRVSIENVKIQEPKGYRYNPQLDPQFVDVSTSLGADKLPAELELEPRTFQPRPGQRLVEKVKLLPVKGVTFMNGDEVTITLRPEKIPTNQKDDNDSE